MTGLRDRIARGLVWDTARTLVLGGAQVVVTVVLARLLAPSDFGVFALAIALVGVARPVVEAGVGIALVQRQQVAADDVRVAFTLAVALGGVVAVGTFLGAPALADAFGQPDVAPVLRALSPHALLVAVSTTAAALLQRRLAFRALAIVDAVSYVIAYAAVGVGLATLGVGWWSLVAAALVQPAVVAVVLVGLARRSPLPPARGGSYRALLAPVSAGSLAGIVEYLFRHVDVVAVAGAVGASSLGVYDRASLLARIPSQHLAASLGRVLVPGLARMQEDRDAFRSTYYRGLAVMGALVLPLGAGLATAAGPLVVVVLGVGWERAVPVFAILGLVAPLHVLSDFTVGAWAASGRTRARLVGQSISFVVLVGAAVVAAPYGLVAVAFALLVVEALRHAAFAAWTARQERPSWPQLAAAYAAPAVGALLVAGAIASADAWLGAVGAGPLARALAAALVGASTMALSVALGPLRHMRPFVAEAWGRSTRRRT